MKTIAAFLLVLCHLAISHAWSCSEVPYLKKVQQIDAGQGKVVAKNKYDHAYFLSGSSWYRLPSDNIKHVTVGLGGLWAIDTSDYVYKLVAGNWARAPGMLKQVDAGGDVIVVGVNHVYNTYCLNRIDTFGFNGVSSISWTLVKYNMTYYSCGPYGCWGVDRSYNVYMATNVSASDCNTTGWTAISGSSLKMIEVGSDGSVFGVNTSGKVYQRTGISSSRPQGLDWIHVPMCVNMKHVSYDLGNLWAVSTAGQVIRCTN